MMLAADTHVHLRAAVIPPDAVTRLRQLAGNAKSDLLFCLTERTGERYFNQLGGKLLSPEVRSITEAGPTEVGVTESGPTESSRVLVAAGSQIVTAEGIEVLALISGAEFPDRKPILATIELLRDSGAVVVLPWSPGKWTGARGKIVSEMFRRFGNDILAGDIPMRPRSLAFPFGRERLLAGSDPLPMAGEEQLIGSYGVQGAWLFNPNDSTRSLKEFLYSRSLKTIGERLPLLQIGLRMARWELARRR